MALIFEVLMVAVPDNRNYEYSYNQSYQLAVEQLAKITGYGSLCDKSDSKYHDTPSGKFITLEYLNRTYRVTLPDITVTVADSNEDVPVRDRILILHYILTAKGTPLSGQIITFKELPEGQIYFRTFNQRTIKHLAANFGDKPDQLFTAAAKYGGTKAFYGDAAVTLPVFSHVPITFVVWKGDEEFPADAGVMYDSTVTDYLPTEDIIVLTETVVWKLVRTAK